MKTKPKAQVCRLNGTNYVTYKGTRYTVKDYNKKFKTRVYIPKNVKVCEPVLPPLYVGDRKYNTVEEMMEIEVPRLRKVKELEKEEENNFWFGWLIGYSIAVTALLIGTLLVLAYSI